MADADDFLRGWVDQLAAMQACAANISTDTNPALAKFCAQKPSDLLSPATQNQFGICMSGNVAIPAGSIAAAATFRALVDVCYRALMNALVGLMRQQAADANPGGNFGGMSLPDFSAVKISVAFSGTPAIGDLCNRLGTASTPTGGATPLFPPAAPAFRKLLVQPNTTVLQAAQSLP